MHRMSSKGVLLERGGSLGEWEVSLGKGGGFCQREGEINKT